MLISVSYKYLKPFHKRFGNLEINIKPIMYCCIVSLSWVNFTSYGHIQMETGKTGYFQPHTMNECRSRCEYGTPSGGAYLFDRFML